MERVATELNRMVAADRHLRLEIGRWEMDAYPGFRLDGPQGICDDVLQIDDCDVLVGIFWTRFGSVTSNGMTGPEHEIRKAVTRWRKQGIPQVIIFFNSAPVKLKSAAERRQWTLVAEYREKFSPDGLFWDYESTPQFKAEFRRCMANYLRDAFRIGGKDDEGGVRADLSQGDKGWNKLVIDKRVPAEKLSQVLTAFSDFVRECGGLGLDVKITGESDYGGVEIEIVLFHVFAVITLRVGKAEEPFLEDWVLAVPKGQREAELLFVIGNVCQAVLSQR